MGFEDAFIEMATILLVAAVVGMVGYLLKQPLIISFIAVGILVGPAGLDLINRQESIQLLAEIGIALLLFVVGLKLDFSSIKTMGPVAMATGLGQVLFTSVIGFMLTILLGLAVVPSIYVAVALTFSSTIIIVKLLSDKGEIDSLHGRIAIGFLIVQDLLVILVMIALTTIGVGPSEGGSMAVKVLAVAGKGLAYLAVTIALTVWALPRLMEWAARSVELILLLSISWAVIWAAVGDRLGFSMEVGAFLAGVSLASTPFRDSVASRLVSIRDFMLLFFFINLGSHLDLALLGLQMGKAVILSLFVLVGNPLIVMIIMGVMGYRKRTGFMAGLAVAQISEFSLILGAQGVAMGHIGLENMGLITLVGLITIGLSTYMIIYSAPLYKFLSPALGVFERKNPFREKSIDSQIWDREVDVILFGLGNYGGNIARHLIQRGKRVIGVDHDPRILAEWRRMGVPVLYGDSRDPEVMDHLPIQQARWIVNSTPGLESGVILMESLRERNYAGKVVLSARRREEAEKLKAVGADMILRPFSDAAEQAVDALTAAMDHLSREIDWPISLQEARLKPGTIFGGKTILETNLRAETGASIMAVSRAGQTYFDPEPDFTLFPGDRLVLLGDAEHLAKALAFLEQQEFGHGRYVEEEFTTRAWGIPNDSAWVGMTLGELNFRRDFGATVIGIQRDGRQIVAPKASETILSNDILLLAGKKSAIDDVVAHCPICRLQNTGETG